MPLLTNSLRSARHAKVAPYVRGDVLELGCGPAAILRVCGGAISRYCGVEFSRGRVEKLSAEFPQHAFAQADLDEDSLALGREFDVVLMLALVEHVYNQKTLFRVALRHLKPGGRIVLTTPTPFGNDVVHSVGARLGLFSKDAMDDHVVVYNRRRFEILARDFGMGIEVYRRFQFGCNQLVVLRKALG